MSNRSLARKNRNRYKAIRSLDYSPRYEFLFGDVGCGKCNGNDRIYNGIEKLIKSRCRAKDIIAKANHPDATASDKILAEIYSGKEINHSFDMDGVYDHQGHVPITVEQHSPKQCYTLSPMWSGDKLVAWNVDK